MINLKNKIITFIEEHRVLDLIWSMILFIFKTIKYLLYKLCYYWKIVILTLVIGVIYIFNQHKGILFNILNNDYVKDITFNWLYKDIYIPLYFIEIVVIVLLIIWLCKNNRLKDYKHNKIEKVNNLTNRLKEAPYIVKIKKPFSNLKITTYIFNKNSIGISTWLDPKIREDLETALNRVIINIEDIEGRKDRVKIDTISPKYKLPNNIYFEDKHISDNNFELVLGENIYEKIKVNIDKTPHLLVGGTTGSGKSILINCLAYQCAKKGAILCFADLKGLDYNSWNNITLSNYDYMGDNKETLFPNQCKVSTNLEDIYKDLSNISFEYGERQRLFENLNCKNINEYNKQNPDKPLSRIIYIFDEFEGLQDENNNKDLVKKITNDISVFATRGRAFGIHLILGAQRPDADTIKGQIRSNLDIRVCGRASDKYMSEIVLGKGNYDASTLIHEDDIGVFVTNNNKRFKGYYIDTENLLKQYEKKDKNNLGENNNVEQ